MKKISLLLVLVLMLCVPFLSTVKAEEKSKIIVYLFRGEGCPHCADAEEFFENLSKDEEYSKYYTLKDYEVWYDKDNSELMDKVAAALGDESGSGVPFIVIGDKSYRGYSDAMADQIKETIKSAYDSDDYKDIVSSVKNGTNIEEKKESSPLIPIIVVSVVAIGTIIGLVFLTKEKK